ncbi:MAG: hypothetical protein KatS3mg061_0869 [Dehalococcoidia bacterium]|nr:MAG: hypothetical protein KatS3mg061_0869 [Dehalococcoidia bacterium]
MLTNGHVWRVGMLALALGMLLLSLAGAQAQTGSRRVFLPLASKGTGEPPGSGQWEVVSAPSTAALFAVAWSDESTVWTVGSGGTVLRSRDRGASWQPVSVGTGVDLYGVRFASAQVGVIAGTGGTVLRTTDGGATWSRVAVASGANLGFLWFASEQVGYLAGDGGTLLRTVDGGASWQRVTIPFDRDITGIHCLDPQTCWAAGSSDTGGVVLRTTDGTGWQQVGGGFTPLGAVWFLDRQVGVVGGDPTFTTGESNLWRTSDGGQSWSRARTDIFGPAITGFAFSTGSTGWASAEERIVLQTDDGGQSWRTVLPQLKVPGQNRWLHAIAARPNGAVVAVGAVYPANGSFAPLAAIIVRRR